MRAELEKKRGVEGGRSPPRGGVEGGRSPPAFANVLAFSPSKSFEKRLWSMNSSNNQNGTIEISRTKIKQT